MMCELLDLLCAGSPPKLQIRNPFLLVAFSLHNLFEVAASLSALHHRGLIDRLWILLCFFAAQRRCCPVASSYKRGLQYVPRRLHSSPRLPPDCT